MRRIRRLGTMVRFSLLLALAGCIAGPGSGSGWAWDREGCDYRLSEACLRAYMPFHMLHVHHVHYEYRQENTSLQVLFTITNRDDVDAHIDRVGLEGFPPLVHQYVYILKDRKEEPVRFPAKASKTFSGWFPLNLSRLEEPNIVWLMVEVSYFKDGQIHPGLYRTTTVMDNCIDISAQPPVHRNSTTRFKDCSWKDILTDRRQQPHTPVHYLETVFAPSLDEGHRDMFLPPPEDTAFWAAYCRPCYT